LSAVSVYVVYVGSFVYGDLTPWSRVVEKPTDTQPVKIFPSFYGTQRFIIVYKRDRQWSLSWARWIQSTASHPFHSDILSVLRWNEITYNNWEPWYLSGIALGYGLDDRGFESRQGLGICLFTTASRPALGPRRLPIQWVAGALYLGIKRPGREPDQTPPSSAEFKNAWRYTSTPQYVFMA
jgi:hypothetical protein